MQETYDIRTVEERELTADEKLPRIIRLMNSTIVLVALYGFGATLAGSLYSHRANILRFAHCLLTSGWLAAISASIVLLFATLYLRRLTFRISIEARVKQKDKARPLAELLFLFFIPSRIRESVEGDLEETYLRIKKHWGQTAANCYYMKEFLVLVFTLGSQKISSKTLGKIVDLIRRRTIG